MVFVVLSCQLDAQPQLPPLLPIQVRASVLVSGFSVPGTGAACSTTTLFTPPTGLVTRKFRPA
jgi:hypothetical protein